MSSRISLVVGLAGAALAAAACHDDKHPGMESTGAGATGQAQGGLGGAGFGGAASGGLGGQSAPTSGTGAMVPCNVDPNVDADHDGFTPAEGDCDDCDPFVNPGAVDVLGAVARGPRVPLDRNCDGKAEVPAPCDDDLLADDGDAMAAARAIELCQEAPAAPATKADRRFGVLSARWTSAAGSEPRAPGLQAGLLSSFGAHVVPQSGKRLLALSSGRARAADQPGACNGPSCTTTSNVDAPDGFPQEVPGCEGGSILNDDVALEVSLRAPTNARGFSFAFKFHSFEYPAWVCTPYNDQFVALVSPPPLGSINGNVAFDAHKNPVSVNLGFFEVCDPAAVDQFASNCGAPWDASCPTPPSPYCAAGPAALEGTGFDLWGDAGATGWLSSRVPVEGGAEIAVRFAIWDTTDQALDSTVLIDGFSWLTGAAVESITMEPHAAPKPTPAAPPQ